MVFRILLYLKTKFFYLFTKSIAFSSRVEFSEISDKAKVWGHCKVFHSTIDNYSYLGGNSRLIYANVGKFCSIGGNCAIGMGTHSLDYISTSSIFTAKKNGTGIVWSRNNAFSEFNTITIGNDVWIGQRVMIMGGVNIGNGAVIGAGALVTKDVPPYAIVGGVPAKIIRYRFPADVIDIIEKSEWWKLDDNTLKENIVLFQKPLDDDNLSKLIKLTNKLC